MTDNDSPEDDETGFDSGFAERQAHYPEQGYTLVEIDLLKPPGEALTKLRHSLRLSAIRIPPTGELTDYVVYDSDGNAYSREDMLEESDRTEGGRLASMIETVQTGEGTDRRLALAQLTAAVEDDPKRGLDAIPVLTAIVDDADLVVQAESVHTLAIVAEEFPEQVTPVADEVIDLLGPKTDEDLLSDAVAVVAAIADRDPGAVVDAAPKLAALLQEEAAVDSSALTALQRISKVHPDAVVPLSRQLVAYVEEGDDVDRMGALAVLGMIAKEYPNIAEETIPMAIELLNVEYPKLRANAAGFLADLADEYPESVRPIVPRAIELLDDDDHKARYNATSILARLGKAYPDDLDAAIDPLIDVVDDEFLYTRSNACWALGYIEAEQAVDVLAELSREDPEEEVRNAAAWAVQNIDNGER